MWILRIFLTQSSVLDCNKWLTFFRCLPSRKSPNTYTTSTRCTNSSVIFRPCCTTIGLPCVVGIVIPWKQRSLYSYLHFYATICNYPSLAKSSRQPFFQCNHSWNSKTQFKIEPEHDKNHKMTCAPREDSDQPGHPLPSVCAQWLAKDPRFLHAESEDSAWADAWADLSLRWAHRSFCWFCHVVAQFKPTIKKKHSDTPKNFSNYPKIWTMWLSYTNVSKRCQQNVKHCRPYQTAAAHINGL